jgi:hypothetical protein
MNSCLPEILRPCRVTESGTRKGAKSSPVNRLVNTARIQGNSKLDSKVSKLDSKVSKLEEVWENDSQYSPLVGNRDDPPCHHTYSQRVSTLLVGYVTYVTMQLDGSILRTTVHYSLLSDTYSIFGVVVVYGLCAGTRRFPKIKGDNYQSGRPIDADSLPISSKISRLDSCPFFTCCFERSCKCHILREHFAENNRS